MEEFQKLGYWWLPESPEERQAGRLIFGHDTEAKLVLLPQNDNLLEAFRELSEESDRNRAKVILGQDEDGTQYTLYNCVRSEFRSKSGVSREVYLIPVVLEGRHFSSSDEMIFQQMTVRLPHLADWYRVTGKKRQIEKPGSPEMRIEMAYQLPDPLPLHFNGGRIELAHEYSVAFVGDLELKERVLIDATPDNPLHMRAFTNEFLSPIIHFFCLGIGQPIPYLEVRGKASADCADGTDDKIDSAPTVQLYWKKERQEDESKMLHAHDMVFAFSDIHDRLESHLQEWLRAHQEIKPVMELFFHNVIARESHSANSFLNSVQAAEAYHRYRRPGNDLSEEDHQERIQSILEAVPESHTDWLEQKLRFSNETVLKKRLKELLTERSSLFDLSTRRMKSLAHRITEIRDHFTHYAGEKDPEFATGHDFYVFDTLLQWTVTACLLEEMGIERGRAHELIKRNQSFLQFVGRNLRKKDSTESNE